MKNFLIVIFSVLIVFNISAQRDTTQNRIATLAVAEYWPSVNVGDYIFFRGNADEGRIIYSNKNVQLNEGNKILIWRGNYERIYINGSYCKSSNVQPTIITNLGGQVKWGFSKQKKFYRTLELKEFEHVFLTGNYDSLAQTGDPYFRGHNNGKNLGNGNYHQEYGMWGNPRWSGERFDGGGDNIVQISEFKTCKVSYVAATEGGFAGFNIKTDNPAIPERVEIDIRDCFIGWTESEGVYISWSTGAENQDLTKLMLKNNIFAFTGTEALQTDNLTEGSVIENNVVFVSACFHRRPFQDLYQDGLHQFSFVEGGITVQNNIMLTGASCHQIRYKFPGVSRAFPSPDKKVLFRNNYYGFARSGISYIWEGDGITPYLIDENVYGPVYTPANRDGYTNNETYPAYIRICNIKTNITYKNNMYPPGRQFYKSSCGPSKVTAQNNKAGVAPLIEFKNSGFADSVDYRNFTFYSPTFETEAKKGIFIPYKVGDIVFYYDENSKTKFFKCIEAHAGDYNPNTSTDKWEHVLWNGNNKPPLNLTLEENSYYANRKMGLNYSEEISLGTENPTKKNGFSVYPNPAGDYLHISTQNILEYNYKLFALNSACIQGNEVKNSPLNKIDISELQSGVYILTITENNNILAWFRIVKS